MRDRGLWFIYCAVLLGTRLKEIDYRAEQTGVIVRTAPVLVIIPYALPPTPLWCVQSLPVVNHTFTPHAINNNNKEHADRGPPNVERRRCTRLEL